MLSAGNHDIAVGRVAVALRADAGVADHVLPGVASVLVVVVEVHVDRHTLPAACIGLIRTGREQRNDVLRGGVEVLRGEELRRLVEVNADFLRAVRVGAEDVRREEKGNAFGIHDPWRARILLVPEGAEILACVCQHVRVVRVLLFEFITHELDEFFLLRYHIGELQLPTARHIIVQSVAVVITVRAAMIILEVAEYAHDSGIRAHHMRLHALTHMALVIAPVGGQLLVLRGELRDRLLCVGGFVLRRLHEGALERRILLRRLCIQLEREVVALRHRRIAVRLRRRQTVLRYRERNVLHALLVRSLERSTCAVLFSSGVTRRILPVSGSIVPAARGLSRAVARCILTVFRRILIRTRGLPCRIRRLDRRRPFRRCRILR